MSDLFISGLVILGAYLIGSVPSSYLLAKYVRGIDIREYGSGNIGATNFATHVSKVWMVPVALYDSLGKGMLPVLIASDKVFDLGIGVAALAALAAVAGHNWPVFLRFSGGRGISVGIGAVIAFGAPLTILWAAIPAIMLTLSPWKDTAVSWMLSSMVLPLWVYLAGYDAWIVFFCAAFTVVMCIRRVSADGIGAALKHHEGISPSRVLFNRVVFDRDIASRDQWVRQQPKS